MGWYGTFCGEELSDIKQTIENDWNTSGIKSNGNQITHEVLTHSFKFGQSYMAIKITETEKDGHWQKIEVVAVITLWRYSKKDNQVMLKTMEETPGPCYYKPTMKLLLLLTPTKSDYAFNWRVASWKQFKKIPECYQEYKEDKDVI